MSYQQTSLWAYQDVRKDLASRQKDVLKVIRNYPKIDNQMISQMLDLPINSITPRVKELRDMGLVKEAGKHKSALTGRTVIGWEIT